MRCPACDAENPEGARFCGSCGESLVSPCPACGAENQPGFRFCGSCGAALNETEAPAEAPAPTLGERRRVTVLFADLVGFSTLAEHLDPEELRTLMTNTFAELTEEVETREGWVEKFIGDAVVAVFGAPVTHEDDPVRAVETALAIHEIVRERSEGAPAPLQLRVGINSGLVVAGAVGDGTQTGVMGDAVNIAARLQQAAEPGEILLAASSWRRVRDAFEAEPVGSLEVKGKAQPVEAYRLLRRLETEGRQPTPFVGRREELALLELLWSSARKGNTHVVSVVGEPGVGKSRLLGEFRPSAAERDFRLTCGGERAFGPFLDLIRSALGDLPSDTEELKAKAAALAVEEADAVMLAAFLGLGEAPAVVRMADEQRRRQVFAGVWQFLLALCRERPTFVVLDDVHWADESSRELLEFLLERIGRVPVMLVLCYRPGFEQVERAELRASHTAIRLEPLTPEESVALARGVLGVRELPADLERLVATRAEGNPFFIEELLQALLELGSLAVVDGKAVLAKVEVEVPDTVQGTILARVDRLDPSVRSILQHAAVLGRGFSAKLLEEVVGDGDIASQLDGLARAQLLVETTPGEWAFKHALIQEVTYETLLLRSRRELHRRVADALESQAGDEPGLLEALAEHYARAEVPEKARRYAVAAGDLAGERMAFSDAQRRYQTALQLWGEGDEEGRLGVLMKLGHAARFAADIAAARTALIEAAEGWRRLGDLQRSGGALAVLGRVYWLAGDSQRAAETLERAIAVLRQRDASPELVQAYTWASTLHLLSGTLVEATELATQGLALAEALHLETFRSHLLNNLGSSEVYSGDPRGADRVAEALAFAKTSGDTEALGRAYNNLSYALAIVGRLPEAVDIGTEGREAMRSLGIPGIEWYIAGTEAAALVDLGRLDEADELSGKVLEAHGGAWGAPGLVNAAVPGISVLLRRGEYEPARALLDEVLPIARPLGGGELLAPLLELEAQLEHARGNHAAAQESIHEATELVFSVANRTNWLRALPAAARLLPREKGEGLLERVRVIPSFPLSDARRAEAEGVLYGDRDRLREAAELYRSLEMPYDDARCRIDAGELEQAREIIERFGFERGPLGQRLATLAV